MEDIQRGVDAVMNGRPATDWAALISRTCAKLGMERFLKNPCLPERLNRTCLPECGTFSRRTLKNKNNQISVNPNRGWAVLLL